MRAKKGNLVSVAIREDRDGPQKVQVTLSLSPYFVATQVSSTNSLFPLLDL